VTPASDEVLVEERGPVLIVTINRPDQRNAMTRSVGEGIALALDDLDARPDLTVGVLTGAGGMFCAGMDLKRFLAGEVATIPGRGFGGFTESPPAKPLIAAVEGYALAGGFELVLACDLVVAGKSAQFGLPEVKRGLVARAGGLLRLPRRIPSAVALEVILTGEMLGADRAAELGLVNRVVADGEVLAEAVRFAEQIGRNAPLAVAMSKRIVVESAQWPAEASFDRQRDLAAPVFDSDDAKEGALAFKEKRAPAWRGR
jgi:enoyl-CoA hydratase